MLTQLKELEKTLPSLLLEKDRWQSVYVDYHKPYVKRLWRQMGEARIYLHKILPCERDESLLHPHPWPSAMKVIRGTYEMGVGYSETNILPPIASTLILPPNSYYEMTHMHSWHYVKPLKEASFSLMLTGLPWKREVPKSAHALPELSEGDREEIFRVFTEIYNGG